jgi:hypothetical protein
MFSKEQLYKLQSKIKIEKKAKSNNLRKKERDRDKREGWNALPFCVL